MLVSLRRSHYIAAAIASVFFLLLGWVHAANVYEAHFFDHGPIITFYQIARILYIPYLTWLQYAVGAYALYWLGGKSFPLRGMPHFIASFLLGTSVWHVLLLGVGLCGFYYYPVMLVVAGGVMLASLPHLSTLLRRLAWTRRLTGSEIFLGALVVFAAVAFIFLKGAYPSGAHDFYNHYFPYYKSVVATGNLGPHESWIHYHYSKGLGLYFMSMLLLDPFAVHLVGASFTFASACIVFDFLRRRESLMLPLWGVFLYLAMYIYTPGRDIYALNGGWGDLEKTHELTAVLLFAVVWLVRQIVTTRLNAYVVTLCATMAALSIIGFAAAVLGGLFLALILVYALVRKDRWLARAIFLAGTTTGTSLVLIMIINYIHTGLAQDQMITYIWNWIDWKKVVSLGYTLELYAQMNDHLAHKRGSIPLLLSGPAMLEYFRFYLLWPLLAIGLLLAVSARKIPKGGMVILFFLLTSLFFALFLGGRAQTSSYFRFSTLNYAPMLVACLLLWDTAKPRLQKIAIWFCVVAMLPWIFWKDPHVIVGWYKIARSATAFNTGKYSLRDAVGDMRGRAGRIRWGGIYPAMEVIYAHLPPHTRVWSLHNHSYCLLPACNMQTYFSQVTSKRWYDIALGSVEEGKKIMQEEGLNFIFYSRSVPVTGAADSLDELAAFYKGMSPENINKVFGILWTNGWDYLLTWKAQSVAPLDDNFMDSWRMYQKDFVLPRNTKFPVLELAPAVKKAADDPAISSPPRPDWLY